MEPASSTWIGPCSTQLVLSMKHPRPRSTNWRLTVIQCTVLRAIEVAFSTANMCIHVGETRRYKLEYVKPLKVQTVDLWEVLNSLPRRLHRLYSSGWAWSYLLRAVQVVSSSSLHVSSCSYATPLALLMSSKAGGQDLELLAGNLTRVFRGLFPNQKN